MQGSDFYPIITHSPDKVTNSLSQGPVPRSHQGGPNKPVKTEAQAEDVPMMGLGPSVALG